MRSPRPMTLRPRRTAGISGSSSQRGGVGLIDRDDHSRDQLDARENVRLEIRVHRGCVEAAGLCEQPREDPERVVAQNERGSALLKRLDARLAELHPENHRRLAPGILRCRRAGAVLLTEELAEAILRPHRVVDAEERRRAIESPDGVDVLVAYAVRFVPGVVVVHDVNEGDAASRGRRVEQLAVLFLSQASPGGTGRTWDREGLACNVATDVRRASTATPTTARRATGVLSIMVESPMG